jgi:hypothetical protein
MSDEQRRHLEDLEHALAPLLIGINCTPDAYGHCVTCADEALPASVMSVDDAAGLALVTVDNSTIEVDISLVDALRSGDRVLIHGGVAIAKL